MWTTISFASANSQPFSLGAVSEDAIRAATVAGSHGDRLGVPLADHLLDDRPTALFERMRVGHQLELAGNAPQSDCATCASFGTFIGVRPQAIMNFDQA
jgi:hypothetical protein